MSIANRSTPRRQPRPHRGFIVAVAAAILFLGLPSASTADPTEPQVNVAVVSASNAGDASKFVRTVGNEVIAILQSRANEKRRTSALHAILFRAFDVERMGRFAVGKYWRQADSRQRAEFLRLFGNHVVALYAKEFVGFLGQSFKVTGERQIDDDDISVRAAILQPPKPAIRLDFRVRWSGNGLRIVDVYGDGLSLLITKRGEFSSVLAREGMTGLNQRLRRVH